MGFWPQNGQKIAKIAQKHPKMAIYWIHIKSKNTQNIPEKYQKIRKILIQNFHKTPKNFEKVGNYWIHINYFRPKIAIYWIHINYFFDLLDTHKIIFELLDIH